MIRTSVILLLALLSALHLEGKTITTAAELQQIRMMQKDIPWTPFALTGTVTSALSPEDNLFVIEDNSGLALVSGSKRKGPPPITAGARIILTGGIHVKKTSQGYTPWCYYRLQTLSCPFAVPSSFHTSIDALHPKSNHLQRVTISGTIVDVKPDEVDPRMSFLFLRDKGQVIAISGNKAQIDKHIPHIGSSAFVTGTYINSIDGVRTFTPPCILLDATDEIRITGTLDNIPQLESLLLTSPKEIANLGMRRTSGVVLATWQPNHYLLATIDYRYIKVRHRATSIHPHVGDHVSVVGFPETDLYSIVLTCADSSIVTNDLARQNMPTKTPVDITPRGVLFDRKNVPCYAVSDQLGSLVRVRGRIRDIQQQGRSIMLVEDDGIPLPVDISDHPSVLNAVPVGCTVEMTGICVLEGEMWTPMNAMPQLKSYTVVIRSPEDIRILARPPWWTPARLMYVIGGLLVALLGFAVWNRLLNRLVEKRSAALLEEQRTSTEAALKIDERTRLAAELHDSLSQNLSALACQVSAAKSTVTDGSETQALLATAERMLQSSRTELTRCLWDLRGDSLEEADFTNAIRNTLARLVLKAKVVIRFNVPRKRVDDTTAHAILCIVRELVSNAVKHGKATEVRIAGETHGSVISFSVRDNGSGFDTEQACGVTEGHFGLEGIRDRVNRLDGTFEIESKPGTGTKATVQLKMKEESTGNEFKE